MEETIEKQIYELLKKHHYTVSTAESATGGLIASTLINVPGISEFFQEGYVTYSNEAKVKMIHADAKIIERYGVVSAQTAESMAIHVAETAGTNASLSVTGVAGPVGGTTECPVGTVYIGCFLNGKTVVEHHVFTGDRRMVREKATQRALTLLKEQIENEQIK